MINCMFVCPKCGCLVHENETFCPECKTSLNFNYGSVQHQSEEEKAFYNSLSIYEKAFIICLIDYFEAEDIRYVVDYSYNYVGFRKTQYDQLVAYLTRVQDNKTRIHLYSLKNKKCASAFFEKDKLDAYVKYVINFLFKKETLDNDSVLSLDELKSKYHYAVLNGSVERIIVDSIVEMNGAKRVYFVLENGSKKFCLLSNIKERLFENKELALKSTQTFNSLDSIISRNKIEEHTDKYVIKDVKSNTFYKGTHQTKNYETVKQRYRRSAGSFVINDVPDFTLKLEKAVVFYYYDSAKRVADLLEPVVGKLQVIKIG